MLPGINFRSVRVTAKHVTSADPERASFTGRRGGVPESEVLNAIHRYKDSRYNQSSRRKPSVLSRKIAAENRSVRRHALLLKW